MSHVERALVAAILAAGFFAQPAVAQSAQKWSLQGSLFSSTLIGDNPIYQNVEPGAGFEVQVRWNPSLFSLGAGFQWTTHKQNLLDSEPDVINDPNTTLNGFFVEPRYVILVGSNTIAPYVSGRVSFLRQTTTAQFRSNDGPATLNATADGINLNAGGGLLLRLGSRLNLDAGATYGYSSFGDFVVEVEGQEFDRAGSSTGQNLAVRLGLVLGL
jgi:hypothetical protein